MHRVPETFFEHALRRESAQPTTSANGLSQMEKIGETWIIIIRKISGCVCVIEFLPNSRFFEMEHKIKGDTEKDGNAQG